MSFGFSISDFVICLQLARKVWRDCRDAADDFRAVATEVASLKLVLKEVHERISNNEHALHGNKTSDLKKLTEGYTEVLS